MGTTARTWGFVVPFKGREIETYILTRATNARTEAANVTIKNLKRTGRGTDQQ